MKTLQTGQSSWERWIEFGQAKENHFLQGKFNQPGQNGELMLGTVADKVSKADLNWPVVGFKYQANKFGTDCVQVKGSHRRLQGVCLSSLHLCHWRKYIWYDGQYMGSRDQKNQLDIRLCHTLVVRL